MSDFTRKERFLGAGISHKRFLVSIFFMMLAWEALGAALAKYLI